MTKRFFLHLSYVGTNYHGWQRQEKVKSVQEVIEVVFADFYNSSIAVVGCGRTDKGVHAGQFFAHVDLPEDTPNEFPETMRKELNAELPPEIQIHDVVKVAENANARFDAVSRTYVYQIRKGARGTITDFYSTYYFTELDADAMTQAVADLVGNHDFRAFCKQPDIYAHTFCAVESAILEIDDTQENIRFEITANRFLRRMIRKIMARLMELGKGSISLEEWRESLHQQKPFKFSNPAYPQGLNLAQVKYPYLSFPTTDLTLP